MLSMWMHIRQGKVSKRKAKFIAQVFLYRFDNRVRGSAERTLIIPIFEQHHRRLFGPLNVVSPGNWQRKPRLWNARYQFSFHLTASFRFCMRSSAEIIPSAPGFTPIGEM